MEDTPNSPDIRILVVDDEESLRDIISTVLIEDGYHVCIADSAEAALALCAAQPVDLVITDIRMGGMNGIELLKQIKQGYPAIEVVIMTSHASLDTAITALRAGAYDYLLKPFEDLSLISAVARRAAEKARLLAENRQLIERMKQQNDELEKTNRLLKKLAISDGLTGLYNHRCFQENLAREVVRSHRYARTFSLIFMDVDFFKQYNDKNGHLEGDRLLRTLGVLLKGMVRGTELVARYGGEEFVILMPETTVEGACTLAENIRAAVEAHPFSGCASQPSGKVTVSVGVSAFPHDGADGETLIRHADEALYHAKHAGRNRVACSTQKKAEPILEEIIG